MEDKNFAVKLFDLLSVIIFYVVFWLITIFIGHLPPHPAAPIIFLKQAVFPYPLWYQYGFLASLSAASLMIIFNPFRSQTGDYGGSHFASEKEIKKFGLRAKDGVILGIKNNQYIRTNEPLSTLIYAPPGTGKTAGVIIPSLLSCRNSAIIHDPKEELYEKTAAYRSKFSKVIKFSPGDFGSSRWNPLSKKELPQDWADIETTISRIAHSFFIPAKKNEDDMWVREARSLFLFWALYLIHKNGETSFPDILSASLDLKDEAPDPQSLIALALSEAELPQRLTLEGNSLISKADREFSGVFGTYKSYMNIFLDTRVSLNLSKSDFYLKELRQEKTSIYLTVKNADQTRLKPILSLFFEIAALTALDHEPTPNEQSITLFIDEFVRLGRMKEVLEMPAIGRSYKLNALFVCQSISQVTDIYGKEGADKLKNTCAYHIVFTQNEANIAKDISDSIGKKTRLRKSYSGNWSKLLKNINESYEGVPLLLPQQIMSLPSGKNLLLVQNHFETPILAKTALWFKDETQAKHIKIGYN